MLRKLTSLSVAIAIVVGGVSARTAAAPLAATGPQTSALVYNEPPLKPGGAASIRQAQGIADLDVWFISGLILASIVAALLLTEEEGDSTGGTATN